MTATLQEIDSLPRQPAARQAPRQQPPRPRPQKAIRYQEPDIDFPEWNAAPPGAPKISHQKPLSGYTRDNAIAAVERSNVDQSKPQDSNQAAHLASYCEWMLKDRARAFIDDAAWDSGLQKNVRQFYVHAAQHLGRTGQ